MTRRDTPRPLTVLLPTLLVAGFVLVDRSDPLVGGAANPVSKESEAKREALAAFSQLPMTFEPNRGQAPKGVQFSAHGGSYQMGISPTAANITVWSRKPKSRMLADRKKPSDAFTTAHMQMKIVGANPKAAPKAEGELETRINYFKGNDSKKWLTDIPVFEKLRYQGVYPGIDVVYYGNQSKYEYDFVVKPGAAPGDITLQFDGAENVRVDPKTGELVLALAEGEFRQGAPVIYQEAFGERQTVSGSYALLDNNQVAFNIDGYDPTRELVIDPPIVGYSGYLGGVTEDLMTDVFVDSQGYAYVVGASMSSDFPITPSIVPSPSSDYMAAYDPTQNDGQTSMDIVVTKVAPPGIPADETRARIVYCTFIGGNRKDMYLPEPGAAIVVDSSGRIYITTETESDNYPTTSGALQPTRTSGVNYDLALTVIHPAGNALLYSTHYGGNSTEYCGGLTLDADGAVVIAGRTTSNTAFPMVNPYQNSGTDEAFILRLVPNFQTLPTPSTMTVSFSTLFGGSLIDQAEDVSTRKDGSNLYIYVSGFTYSKNFPLKHHLQVANPSDNSTDAFISKLLWNGSTLSLEWSTLLGANGEDHAYAIETRSDGVVFVGGRVSATPLAVQSDPYRTISPQSAANPVDVTGPSGTYFSNSDGFVIRLQDPVDANPASRTRINYWTIFGAAGWDQVMDLKFDLADSNTVWITGMTSSQTNTNPAFPIANAVQDSKTSGDNAAFVAKLNTTVSGMPGVGVSTFWGAQGPTSHDWGAGIAPTADNCPIIVGQTRAPQDFPVIGGPQTNYGGGLNDGFIAKICPNDTVPFQIYKVDITSVSSTGAVVTWQTNRASNSRVRIGTSSGNYFREVQPTLSLPTETTGNVYTHRVVIGDGVGTATALPANTATTDSPLTPNTVYYVQVLSTTPSPVENAQSADVRFLTTAPYPKFRITSTTFRNASTNPGKFFTHVKIQNTGGATANAVSFSRVRFWSLKSSKTSHYQDWETIRTTGNAFGSPNFGIPSGSGTASGNLGVNQFGYLQYGYDDDTAFISPANTAASAAQALHIWSAGQSARIDITGSYTNSAGPGGTFAASHRIRMPASPTAPAALP